VIWTDRACGVGIRLGGLSSSWPFSGLRFFSCTWSPPLREGRDGRALGYALPRARTGFSLRTQRVRLPGHGPLPGTASFRSSTAGRTGDPARKGSSAEGERTALLQPVAAPELNRPGAEGGKVLLARQTFFVRFLEPAPGDGGEKSPDDLTLEQLPPGGSVLHAGWHGREDPFGAHPPSATPGGDRRARPCRGFEGEHCTGAYKNVESREVLRHARLGRQAALEPHHAKRESARRQDPRSSQELSLPYEDRGSTPRSFSSTAWDQLLSIAWEDGTLYALRT